MRYFIGMDVAKSKHTACVIDTDGVVHVVPFDFTNDALGFNVLWKTIRPFVKKDHLAGMKDTGHYGDNLRKFLFDKHCKLVMMNPSFYRNIHEQSVDCATIRQFTRMRHVRTEEISRYKNQLQKASISFFRSLIPCST